MDLLLNVEPVTSQHNLPALRRLYDRVESHVRGLRALGVTPDSYGSLLRRFWLRLIVSWKTSNDVWNMDSLMKGLQPTEKAPVGVGRNCRQQQHL